VKKVLKRISFFLTQKKKIKKMPNWKPIVGAAVGTAAVGTTLAIGGVAVSRHRANARREQEQIKNSERLKEILKKEKFENEDDVNFALRHINPADTEKDHLIKMVSEYIEKGVDGAAAVDAADAADRIHKLEDDAKYKLLRLFPTEVVMIELLNDADKLVRFLALFEIERQLEDLEVKWSARFVPQALLRLPKLLDDHSNFKPAVYRALLRVLRSKAFRETKGAKSKEYAQLLQNLKSKEEKELLESIYTIHPPDEKYKIQRLKNILEKEKFETADDVNFALKYFFDRTEEDLQAKRPHLEAMVKGYDSVWNRNMYGIWVDTKMKMLTEFPTVIADYDFYNDENQKVRRAALSALEKYPEKQWNEDFVSHTAWSLSRLLKGEDEGLHPSARFQLLRLKKSHFYQRNV
jgi:hypothetical protein